MVESEVNFGQKHCVFRSNKRYDAHSIMQKYMKPSRCFTNGLNLSTTEMSYVSLESIRLPQSQFPYE